MAAPDVRLIEGRWQDVLPGTYDPAHAVVITDPPYGLGMTGGTDGAGKGYEDETPWREHVAEVLAGLPAARHVIRGPATSIVAGGFPAARRLCIEVATYSANTKPFTVPHRWQGWCCYGRMRIGRRPRPPYGDVVSVHPYRDDGIRRRGARAAHRGLTPWEAAAWIVELWTEPGWTVLDPFAGTGTIGRAARVLGHPYIGAERDPTWAHEGRLTMLTDQPALGL